MTMTDFHYKCPSIELINIESNSLLCLSPASTEQNSSDMGSNEDLNF